MTEDEKIVSIVIVCMNRTDNLYPCLESIRKFNSVNCEILVVAYLFDRKKLAQAREDFPEVRFIDSRQTRGFSENNNLALRQARGRYCFILNDDTLFTCDALKSLVEDMEALPRDAAIVSPKLLNSDMRQARLSLVQLSAAAVASVQREERRHCGEESRAGKRL